MGRWMKSILEPTESWDEQHISEEALACLAEGRVTPEEREAYSSHLRRCSRCYEIFAETLRLLAETTSETRQESHWSAHRRVYALAASVLLVLLLSSGLFLQHYGELPQSGIVSLSVDAQVRTMLMENQETTWKGERAARLANVLKERGVSAKAFRQVVLDTPYYLPPTKDVFLPKEKLDIRIEGDTAYVKVVKEDVQSADQNATRR